MKTTLMCAAATALALGDTADHRFVNLDRVTGTAKRGFPVDFGHVFADDGKKRVDRFIRFQILENPETILSVKWHVGPDNMRPPRPILCRTLTGSAPGSPKQWCQMTVQAASFMVTTASTI